MIFTTELSQPVTTRWLDDLNLSDCNILVSRGFLPLKRLSVWRCDFGEDQERLQLGSPETLHILHPGAHISRLISGFGPRQLNHLVKLWLSDLTVQQVELFFRFLGQCPRLESLTIYSPDNHITLPPVHCDSLLHLHHLVAPSIFHQVLTPGRLVDYVHVLRNNGVVDEEDYDRLMQVCRTQLGPRTDSAAASISHGTKLEFSCWGHNAIPGTPEILICGPATDFKFVRQNLSWLWTTVTSN
ncbi:hypothetical protein MVEN_00492800 [Mycena venus]|uniref:F-box domain-containing protein n=1 Tax=Mycena venus TaxID=2733690 RepID=A0A8H6YTQ2_9AGAR|nr:hypothetical protein MVEN_00492800 [Mycena venus]